VPSEDDLNDVLDKDRLRNALLGLDLTLRDRHLVEARLTDVPVAEIANELGISRQRVDQIWSSLTAVAAAKLDRPRRRDDPHLALNPAYPDWRNPRRAFDHSGWPAWSDRPPAVLPYIIKGPDGLCAQCSHICRQCYCVTTIAQIEQAAPEWLKAQSWPTDYATFRTERHVHVIAGGAQMPKVQNRWINAHAGQPRAERPSGLLRDINRIQAPATVQYRSWQWKPRKGKADARPGGYLRPHGSVRGELGHAEAVELLKSLKVAGMAVVKHPASGRKKKSPMTEVEVIEAYRQIPEDAVEPALAKLSAIDRELIIKKFGQPMAIPALARFRQQSYAKTLPALHRAVKRLQEAARKPRLIAINGKRVDRLATCEVAA